jgi:hypothetical protein
MRFEETAQMNGMRIHGKWSTALAGPVLLTYFAGNFNIEGAQARFEDLMRQAPVDTPWAAMNASQLWEASSLDALDSLRQQREWMFAHGCVCIATVLPDTFHQSMLRHGAGNFTEEQVRYFLSIEDACAWLTERGFPITPASMPEPDWQPK